MIFKLRHTTIFIITLLIFSCASNKVSFKVIETQPYSIQENLKMGDVVTVTTKDSNAEALRFMGINRSKVLIGKDAFGSTIRIPLHDITKLEKRQNTSPKGDYGQLLFYGLLAMILVVARNN